MTPLCELAKKHRTDKYKPHNYTPLYYDLLAARAQTVKCVLEIGIGRGGSLRMWEEFFPNAQIVGVDINERALVNEGRIKSVVGDQNDAQRLAVIAAEMGNEFDIIIDDGAHDPNSQSAAARSLLKYLAKDGIYFIEDIKNSPAVIAKRLPSGFYVKVYEGSKMQPSGWCEQLMIITRA